MKIRNFQGLITPILVVLLVVAAFLIGVFWTKVQMLEKGTVSDVKVGANPGAPAKPAVAALSGDKFNELVKDAIFLNGNRDAKVKIVEFTDFECPYCGSFFSTTYPQIAKEYLDSGKVGFYIRHFPLYSIHPDAENGSLAVECAKEQDKFVKMHDMLFANQKALTVTDLKSYGVKIGLNTSQFNSCLDSKKYKDNVDRDAKLGDAAGVSGTPAFFINGKFISGAQAFATFKTTIDQELK